MLAPPITYVLRLGEKLLLCSSHWGVILSSYRLYRLDGAGKITAADWLEADSDEEALEKARAQQQPTTCEIWDRGRLVGAIPPYRG